MRCGSKPQVALALAANRDANPRKVQEASPSIVSIGKLGRWEWPKPVMRGRRSMRKTNVRYRIGDATSADEAWLEGLRRLAYADLFDTNWGGWDEARHSRQFSESMKRGNISIIEVDGERVGMVQLLEDSDGLEVVEIQIHPRYQNRGIGTSLLLNVISSARAQGRDVRLSVGLKNEKAIRLYERLGFLSVGRSDTHLHMMYEESG